MAKRSRMSEDKAIEEILRFVENSDGESDINNNQDLTNNNLSLLNGNEDIFLQEQTDIEEEDEQEKEDERTKIFRVQLIFWNCCREKLSFCNLTLGE